MCQCVRERKRERIREYVSKRERERECAIGDRGESLRESVCVDVVVSGEVVATRWYRQRAKRLPLVPHLLVWVPK